MTRNLKLRLLVAVARRLRERHERDLEAAALHRELLHRLRDAPRELVRREAPLFRELLRKLSPPGLRRRGALRERVEIGRFRECGELRLGLRQQFGQRLGTHAVLACRGVDRRLPLFDASELRGVDVELAAVGAELARRLDQLDVRGLEQRGDVR